jgi:hypothetical protein
MVERPDLTGLPAGVIQYIEYLETQLNELSSKKSKIEPKNRLI